MYMQDTVQKQFYSEWYQFQFFNYSTYKCSSNNQRLFLTLPFQDIVYNGIHFPPNMDTPNTVSKVLAQKPGKMKASKLRQGTQNILNNYYMYIVLYVLYTVLVLF